MTCPVPGRQGIISSCTVIALNVLGTITIVPKFPWGEGL